MKKKGKENKQKMSIITPNSHTRTICQLRSYFRRVEILILVIFQARQHWFLSVKSLFSYCGKTEVMAPPLELSGWDTLTPSIYWPFDPWRWMAKPSTSLLHIGSHTEQFPTSHRTSTERIYVQEQKCFGESPIMWRMTALICWLRGCLSNAIFC